MTSKTIFDFARVVRAAGYSGAGLRWLGAYECAFRQELALFAVLLCLSLVRGMTVPALAVEIGLMSLILLVEALNTALEKLVDRISLERHPQSALVKDIGSAAVALSFVPLAAFWVVELCA